MARNECSRRGRRGAGQKRPPPPATLVIREVYKARITKAVRSERLNGVPPALPSKRLSRGRRPTTPRHAQPSLIPTCPGSSCIHKPPTAATTRRHKRLFSRLTFSAIFRTANFPSPCSAGLLSRLPPTRHAAGPSCRCGQATRGPPARRQRAEPREGKKRRGGENAASRGAAKFCRILRLG